SEQTPVFLQRLQMYALGFELRMGKVSSWQVVSVQGKDVDAYLKDSGLPVPAATPLGTAQDENTFAMRMIESADDGVWLMGADLKLENNVDESVIEQGRILCGRPRFGLDWNQKLHPLNANLMERGGVSFDKGCYVGQEVTSRMQWRGGIKKKLYRVQIESLVENLPCPVLTTTKIGEITSLAKHDVGGYRGIALLPIEVAESEKTLVTDEGLSVRILGVCDV
ncbi:MAG: tRNA-modifying protein YgfZ, partial [Ghiorsea sp.]